MLPSPIPPITIDELVDVTRMLARNGATIQQLNTIRKHLELLKVVDWQRPHTQLRFGRHPEPFLNVIY